MTECHVSRHICAMLFLAAIVVGLCLPQVGYGQVSVLTYHNDNSRTGQNLNETTLTPANVNQNSFGQLFSANVDGYVVGQPLYLQNVAVPNLGMHNVVYVATLHDSVYAFDADTGALLWQVSFINPAMGITSVPVSDTGCAGVTKFTEHGVVGTGVIDPNSGTLYLVAKTKENGAYFQRLHALDVGSGQEKFGGPVVISATFLGTGDGGTTVNFDPLREMSRAAVLQIGNTIFLSFAANGCKTVHNHGWMLAYDATSLQQTGVFNTTPNGNNGGIWQGGSGPAADGDGNIFFETADAVFDANTGGPDFGDSILNLNLGANGLALVDSFTPVAQANDNALDRDLGSVGPVLLPDQPGGIPHLLVGSGKDATIYVVNRDNMGGYNPLQDQIVQEIPSPFTNSNQTRFEAPSYWNGMVYLVQTQTPVVAYSVSNGLLSALPVSQTSVSYQKGFAPSISANGTINGILWLVVFANATGSTLHAFDPTNLPTEFYNSDQAGTRDTLSLTPDFATPTIANGRVYVGTQTQFVTYGLLGVAPVVSLSPTHIDFGNQTVNTTSAPQVVTLTNTGTSNLSVRAVAAGGDFAQTNTCNSNIAVGSSCTITVTFTPTVTGARSGAITITDNAADSPQSVSLSGTGVASAPTVNLSPGSLNFANQIVGTTSPIQSSTLTNTGAATLSLTAITANGDFALTTTGSSCPYAGGTVNAGAGCTIDVTFTPTAAGTRLGAVTVTDNASDSPQGVSLSGTGVTTAPAVNLSPGSLNFASQTVGTTSPIQSSTLTNTGTATLSVTSIATSGDFALATTSSSCPYSGGTVNAGTGCTIDVTFTPTQAGNRTGSVAIVDNAADSPQALNLTGTGAQSANPVPLINQPLVPAVAVPGGAAFTLTVNGAGFVPAAVVNWNGQPRTTTYISGTQLTAAIGAADITSTNTALITVTNPAAGVAESNAVSFGVTNPTPSLWFSRSDVALGANSLAAQGDFNNDGKPDLAVANSAGAVSVLLSNGDGTFQPAVTYPADSGPDAVAVGDFNGDGKLDLAVANSGGNDVSVLLGNGDGTFQPVVNYGTGNDPDSLAVGDFNGDGKLDLAVGNASDNTVSVLLGNGDGSLQAAVNYPVGNAPVSAVVGDFNGDGLIDLAVANSGDNTVGVLLGNGDGTFQASLSYAVGIAPQSLAAGDFDGNGRLDLVVANSGSNSLSVLRGNGDGTFQAAVTYGAGTNPSSVTLGDLNGDGKLDLAWSNSGDNTTSTLLGNGDGTFQSPVAYPVGNGPGSVLIGDFASNGRFDLVVVNKADATLSVLLQAPVFSLSASGLNFGNQNVGSTSSGQTVTVTNAGSATLYISGRTIIGSNPADFSETDNCGSSLVAGASCTATVTFTPAAAGPRSASLSFTDNAAGSPHNVSLSGTGTVPGVGLSPSGLSFALQLVGTPSAAKLVTVTNTGTGTLTVSSVAITGANSSDFSQTNTCATSVAPGNTCTISVTFTPTNIGTRLATLNVSDNAPGSPQSVSLTGVGTVVQLSPTQINLGTVLLGTQGSAQAITLKNTGSKALRITGVAFVGANSGDFTQTNNCGSSVPAGASCVINVAFAPRAIGVRNASLSISDSGGGGSQKAAVTGTGTSVKLSATNLNFGNQKVGTTSPPQTVTLTNVGAAALNIGMSLKGANPADFIETNNCGSSVAAGAQCTITVKFKPKAKGSRSAIVSISDNGGASPQTISLSGNGT
jgi:hypothetical protein